MKAKSYVVEHPQQVCVCAALMHQGDVLLVRRRDTDSFLPGYWDLPGGVKEGTETCIEALGRELREETGHSVDLFGATPCHVFDYRRTDCDPAVVMTTITYLVPVPLRLLPTLSEHDAADWVAEGDLGQRRMTQALRRAIVAAFERRRR